MKMGKEKGYGKRRIACLLFLKEGIEIIKKIPKRYPKKKEKGKGEKDGKGILSGKMGL